MYFALVRQYARALRTLEGWLDTAEHHAATEGFDVQDLLNARLAPDMANLIYQVQSVCDYAKGAAALLTGQQPPRHQDTEATLPEVRARIAKTVAFIESVPESAYKGAAQRSIKVSWSPEGKAIKGRGYLSQVSVPNVYFHLVTAYAILRHRGVKIGKMDFIGPVNWIDA